MKRRILMFVMYIFLFFTIPQNAFATEITWSNTTLEAQKLSDVQTINVSGTITLNGSITINNNANITIQGDCTFIRGDGNTEELFDIWNAATLTIKGNSETERIIIDGKNIESHTAIRNDENLILENVTIQNNNCVTYRGMVTNEETGETDETDISSNSKDTSAGGAITIIQEPSGSTSLKNCIIQNCAAKEGAAIYMVRNGSGNVDITNTIIRNCEATGTIGGGAIFIDGKPKTDEILVNPANYVVNITESTIENCTAAMGGAIYMYRQGVAKVNITNTTIQKNRSESGSGGTVRSDGVSSYQLTVDNSSIQDNYSYAHGGGIYWNASGANSKLIVKGNTKIINNEAVDQGGGLFVEGRSIEILSATIEGNTARLGGGIGIKTFANAAMTGYWTSNDSFNLSLSDEVIVRNNIASEKGGGLAYNIVDAVDIVENGYTFNFTNEGAVFDGNKVSSDGITIDGVGGAIAIIDATTTCNYNVNTNIKSGTFTNNYAKDGGAIHITLGKFLMSNGEISNHDVEGDGGAIYIANGNAIIEGGTIKSCSAKNGGAIYITSGDFVMKSGVLQENKASAEGGALYVNDGSITIGLESCKGENNTHIHPVLMNNEATNNGGAISIVGGEIKMYCGNLVDNDAIKNQASNSVNQTGGVFSIWGGNLGIGVIVTEDSIFNDYRPVIYQVVYHAIYDDIDVSEQININANELLRLPSAEELENPNFKRLGFVLLGWSTNPTSSEGYIKVGESIPIPENVDLYAVWEAKTFIIYIPEAIEISDDKQGIITLSVEMDSFDSEDIIDIVISNMENLVLEDTSINLTYNLSEVTSQNILKEGDVVATFRKDSLTEKNVRVNIVDTEIPYSGMYSALITFEINTLFEN